ncbi:extracellular solute-binding protein [Paenibacillus sp. GCM10012306]|uniref:extracellular solute-binding protein n=1 Tax=Paenibacillus sp. GCM10012306 TaxID=3317342 RepID=UPI00361C00E1
MRKLKPLSLLSLVFVLLFSLTACSGGSQNSSSASQNAGNTAKADATNEPVKEEEVKQEEVKPEETYDLGGREIKIGAWWDGTPKADTPEGEKAIQKQAEIEKKYNIKIKYVAVDYFELAEKFTSTVMAGDPFADIMLAPAAYIRSFVKGGYLTALDDVMNVKEETKLSDSIIEAGSYGTGKTYGFVTGPPLFDNTGVLYNKRLFDEAGLPTPEEYIEKGEWTWDTFLDVAKKLTKSKGGSGKIDQWGFTGSPFSISTASIYSNGGVIFDEDTQKIAIDSPEAMEGLEFANKLYNEYKVVKKDEGNDWEDPARYFREGQVAMYPVQLFEVAPRFQNQMEDPYVFVPFPSGPKSGGKFIMGMPQLHVNVIPRGVKDANVVYKIWEDLQSFDTIDEDNQTIAESWFDDEISVNNAMNTFKIMKFARYAGLGVEDNLNQLYRDIIAGKTTPSAGVAKIFPALESAADKVLKGE